MSQSSGGPHGPGGNQGAHNRGGPPPMPNTPPTVGMPRVPARRRSPLLIGGVLVVILALAAVLTVVLLRDTGKGDDEGRTTVASSATPSAAPSATASANTPSTPGSSPSPAATTPPGPGASPAAASALQRAKDRGYLVIGAKEDQPWLGALDPATGKRWGFDIEMARVIAAKLGFDPGAARFKTVDSVHREDALQYGEIDFYIGTYAITDRRKQNVSFAGPYFVTGQSVLVRSAETAITGVNATLNGRKVCGVTGTSPEQYLKTNFPQAQTIGRPSYVACVQDLLDGRVDAVSTDDAILKGYAASLRGRTKVVGPAVTTEKYGVGIAHDDTALRDAVNDAIEQVLADGTWWRIYDRTLGAADAPDPVVPRVERY
ncbi:MAG: glutamate ABC transporter substrate-binding protein [Streptomycetaceae bacterium]|nr:glutamate ABC transporter substrate-binding protein [Streptomycetaceae bacterium]